MIAWLRVNRSSLLRLVGVIALLVLIGTMDLSAIWQSLSQIQSELWLASVLLLAPLFALKAERWRLLLSLQGTHYPFGAAFSAVLSSFYASLVTPARVGDLVRVAYVRQDTGASAPRTLASLVVDRLIDLETLLLVAALGLVTLSAGLDNPVTKPLTYVALPLILGPLLIFYPPLGRLAPSLLCHVAPTRTLGKRTSELLEEFYAGARLIRQGRLVLPVTLLTLMSHLVYFTQCYLVARALHLNLSWWFAGFAVSVASLVSLLPVTVAGMGTREATLVLLLGHAGIAAETALAYSLAIFAVFGLAAGLWGFLAWWRHPVRWRTGGPAANAQPSNRGGNVVMAQLIRANFRLPRLVTYPCRSASASSVSPWRSGCWG